MGNLVFLSIVIPIFNEEDNLDELITRTLKSLESLGKSFEIILVDDGSCDQSVPKIIDAYKKQPEKIIGVILNRNYGQHAAVMAGFAQAKGEIIVTLDADLQNPPEEITKLVNKILEGFDVVGSVRICREDSMFRKIASWLINKVVQKSTGVLMKDYGCMLRAYRKNIVKAMLECQERSTFIPILANNFAKKTVEIPVKHDKRSLGKSKYSIFKLINLQFDLLTSMTTFPLRLLSILGVFMAILGIGVGSFIFIMRLIYGEAWAVQGVFTLFAILFVFMGIQFMGMGLLGEYIGRIYSDVRKRPRYFIQEIIGKNRGEQK